MSPIRPPCGIYKSAPRREIRQRREQSKLCPTAPHPTKRAKKRETQCARLVIWSFILLIFYFPGCLPVILPPMSRSTQLACSSQHYPRAQRNGFFAIRGRRLGKYKLKRQLWLEMKERRGQARKKLWCGVVWVWACVWRATTHDVARLQSQQSASRRAMLHAAACARVAAATWNGVCVLSRLFHFQGSSSSSFSSSLHLRLLRTVKSGIDLCSVSDSRGFTCVRQVLVAGPVDPPTSASTASFPNIFLMFLFSWCVAVTLFLIFCFVFVAAPLPRW